MNEGTEHEDTRWWFDLGGSAMAFRLPCTFVSIFSGVLSVAVLLSASSARAEEEKVLNVYNWADYIGDETIPAFEKETGIKVRYDNFDNNEVLHAKLVAGKSGYDVVVPSSYFAKVQAQGGLLRPLDRTELPNLKNLDPTVQEALAKVDADNKYMVPWLWGYTTLGINVGKVKKALGDLPMPDNAWDLLFDPKYVARLKKCGVSVVDSPTEVVPPALHYLGKPAYSSNPADYDKVPALLASIRKYITVFSSTGYIDDLAAGSICLALGFSGDINIAKRRAVESNTGQQIQALVPKTGGIVFVDVMVIPADAPHPTNALRFINYILRPEVAAGITNKVFYANPNKKSLPFVKPEVANDRTIFPAADDMKRMATPDVLSNETRKLITRIYTKFKTGK
jgi:putrescine transport system substrate-binding protein